VGLIEKKFIVEATPALTLCALGEVAAGAVIEGGLPVLLSIAGLMAILPPAMGMRGNVFGSLVSKLSTRLHLGTVEPSLRDRALARLGLMAQWEVSVLSVVIPLLVVASMMRPDMLLPLVFIALFGGLIAGVATLFVALSVTVLAYRKGVNPDNVASPVVTTAADFITAPAYISVASLALVIGPSAMLALTGIALTVLAVGTLRARTVPEIRESVRQRIPVLLMSAGMSTVAGLFLEGNLTALASVPLLIALVPVVNGQGGNLSSVLASRLSTAYYLGSDDLKLKRGELLNALTAGAIVYAVIFAVVAPGAGDAAPLFALLMAVLLLATCLTGWVLSHLFTLLSTRLKLDPDNTVIPILTSCMDLAGISYVLICASMIFGI
jgi:mgtE-like transporter